MGPERSAGLPPRRATSWRRATGACSNSLAGDAPGRSRWSSETPSRLTSSRAWPSGRRRFPCTDRPRGSTGFSRESFTDEQRRGLYLVTTSAGEPVAYILLKARVYSSVTKWNLERFHLGSLVDWRIFDSSAVRLEQLVLLAVEALEEWDVAGVEVCVPEHEPARLGRLGFLPAGAQHVFVRGVEGSALARPQAREARAWWLRPGEGDHVFS